MRTLEEIQQSIERLKGEEEAYLGRPRPRYRPGMYYRGSLAPVDVGGAFSYRGFAEEIEEAGGSDEEKKVFDHYVRRMMSKGWKKPDAEKRLLSALLKYREGVID